MSIGQLNSVCEDGGCSIGSDREDSFSAEGPPLIQLNVNDPEDCRIFTLGASTQDLTDLLGVGGELAELTVSFGEVDRNEAALGCFEDGADGFGGGFHGWLLWYVLIMAQGLDFANPLQH